MSSQTKLGAFLILAVMLIIQVSTAVQESATNDEAIHLSAGLSYWRTGDFRMNPEHPPLVKMLAAMPLVFSPVTLPLTDVTWANVDEWNFGDLVLYQNRLSPDTLLLLGRLPIMLLSLLLGWYIFRVSRSLWGTAGGFISLGLYAFDPSIIAHSRYVTTDLGFTALAFFTLIRLERLIIAPTRRNVIWFGVVFLGACLTKFSIYALIAGLIGLWIALKIHRPDHPAVQAKNIWKAIGIGLPTSLVIIWAVYGLDYRRPIDDPRISQLYVQRQEALNTNLLNNRGPLEKFVVNDLGDRNSRLGSLAVRLEYYHYPLYTFFRGAISVIGHSEAGHQSYLLGQVRDLGWWYYFPVAFIAKTSLPTLLALITVLIMFGAWLLHTRRKQPSCLATFRAIDQRWLIYAIPPLIYFVTALFSHLNLGWRHIMPIYPPLLVLAGMVGTIKLRWLDWRKYLIPIIIVTGAFITEAATYPNQIGYFSPLVGGNGNGWRIMRDSNLDWGQDLPKLRTFMRQRGLTSIPFAFYGRADFSAYIPNPLPLPTTSELQTQARPTGYAAISVGRLWSRDGSYRWLWDIKPVTILGSSIYVYKL